MSMHELVQYPKYKYFAFPQLQCVLCMFLNFGHFEPHVLLKMVHIKKSVLYGRPTRTKWHALVFTLKVPFSGVYDLLASFFVKVPTRFFNKNNFIRTTRFKFGQKLRTIEVRLHNHSNVTQ